MTMSERERVLKLAGHLLDVPYADPDDDVRTLARELVRATEQRDRTILEFYSAVADICRRIGPAARSEWVREQLESVLNDTKFRTT